MIPAGQVKCIAKVIIVTDRYNLHTHCDNNPNDNMNNFL